MNVIGEVDPPRNRDYLFIDTELVAGPAHPSHRKRHSRDARETVKRISGILSPKRHLKFIDRTRKYFDWHFPNTEQVSLWKMLCKGH